jgi:molecular chaperone HtpG
MSETATEQFGFQAEVARLLHLMTHSIYSEREVFLRELISNAADACDRRRYEALTNPDVGTPDFAITITADPGEKRLTVADNGIGMARQELIDNLGTIARSGTARALEAAKGSGQSLPDLIGQFGVGFYAAFIVADKVTVTSRRAGTHEAWSWESDGLGQFTLAPAQLDAAGTIVTLHLKNDAAEFAEKYRLETIIKTHSNHVGVPVKLGVLAEVPEAVNSAAALWTKPKSEISAQDYEQFYRHVAGAFDSPLHSIHFRVEGRQEYTALLFVPETPPFDLFDPERKSRVKLFVRRVFITAECDALLPSYLRFLRGVVDSQDLSLNISREMLQKDPHLAAMKKAIIGRVLGDFTKLATEQPETYTKLWEAFGRVLKEGVYEDFERRDELLKLARFKSSAVDGWTSLAAYIARKPEHQKSIYFVTADSVKAAANSPQLEGFKANGIEVLYFTDPIDEFWAPMVDAFEGVPLTSITRAEADVGTIANSEEAAPQADLERLIAMMKSALDEGVSDVRASQRLASSPVCLVAPEGGMDLRLQRMLKAADRMESLSPRVLEINPRHPLIKRLAAHSADAEKVAHIQQAAKLLLDAARILEGEPLPDAPGFAHRLSELMLSA